MSEQLGLPFEPSKPKGTTRKVPTFPDTPEGDLAREEYEWKQATRKDRKGPARDLKPEDRKPKEQNQGTRSYREPTEDDRLAAAEEAAVARAAWRSQLGRS